MKKIRRSAFIAMLAMLVGVSAAQTTTAPTQVANVTADTNKAQTQAAPQLQNRYPRYKISAGDSFDVNFELSPEFNQTVTVQPDGFITMRGVGDMHVVGQTVPELTATLKKAYSPILNDPQISVVLKDFEKPYFIADGQVGRPGKYDLRGDVTVTEAVAIAGGFRDSAKHSQVLLFRRVSDEWVEAKIINVKKMMKTGNLHEDMYLHPGDMIVVPKNTISKIERFIPNASMGAYSQIGQF